LPFAGSLPTSNKELELFPYIPLSVLGDHERRKQQYDAEDYSYRHCFSSGVIPELHFSIKQTGFECLIFLSVTFPCSTLAKERSQRIKVSPPARQAAFGRRKHHRAIAAKRPIPERDEPLLTHQTGSSPSKKAMRLSLRKKSLRMGSGADS
jgi:hypothetical protein